MNRLLPDLARVPARDTLGFASHVHQYHREYISTADKKAAFVFAVSSTLLVYLYQQSLHLRWLKAIAHWSTGDFFTFVAMAVLFVSLAAAASVVWPRLATSHRGFVFFLSVSEYENASEYAASIAPRERRLVDPRALVPRLRSREGCAAKVQSLGGGDLDRCHRRWLVIDCLAIRGRWLAGKSRIGRSVARWVRVAKAGCGPTRVGKPDLRCWASGPMGVPITDSGGTTCWDARDPSPFTRGTFHPVGVDRRSAAPSRRLVGRRRRPCSSSPGWCFGCRLGADGAAVPSPTSLGWRRPASSEALDVELRPPMSALGAALAAERGR